MSLAGRDLTIGYSDRVVGRGLNVALRPRPMPSGCARC
jgi:hypothetical protein